MSARLFEPLRLDDLELENRIIIAPMCQYSALAGAATDWHLMHLGQLAQSGAAGEMVRRWWAEARDAAVELAARTGRGESS